METKEIQSPSEKSPEQEQAEQLIANAPVETSVLVQMMDRADRSGATTPIDLPKFEYHNVL